MLKVSKVFLLTGLYGLSAVLPKAIGFFAMLWIAKTLSRQDYAVFGLLYAIQAGLGTLTVAGIVEVVVGRSGQEANPRYDVLYDSANSTFVLITIAWCTVGAFALIGFGRLDGSALIAVVAAAISGVGLGFSTLQSQLLVIQERHANAIRLQFASSISTFLGGGLLFSVHPSLTAFFSGAAATILTTLAYLSFKRIGHFGVSLNAASVRPILFGIRPFILIGLLGWLTGYGNNYVVGALLTLRDVADFTFLLSLSATIQIVGSSLNQVWSPRLYRLYQVGKIDEMEASSGKAFRISAMSMGLASALLLLLYKPLIDLVGGNLIAYREKTIELALMCATFLAVIPVWYCQNYFVASGRSKDLLRSTVIGTTLGFGTWIAMVLWLGSIGVFTGYLLQGIVRSCVVLLVARRHWRIRVPWGGILLGTVLLCAGLL